MNYNCAVRVSPSSVAFSLAPIAGRQAPTQSHLSTQPFSSPHAPQTLLGARAVGPACTAMGGGPCPLERLPSKTRQDVSSREGPTGTQGPWQGQPHPGVPARQLSAGAGGWGPGPGGGAKGPKVGSVESSQGTWASGTQGGAPAAGCRAGGASGPEEGTGGCWSGEASAPSSREGHTRSLHLPGSVSCLLPKLPGVQIFPLL